MLDMQYPFLFPYVFALYTVSSCKGCVPGAVCERESDSMWESDSSMRAFISFSVIRSLLSFSRSLFEVSVGK